MMKKANWEMDPIVATGIDEISSKLLKATSSAICPSLAYLINKSCFQISFPKKWKIARVTPIYKGGTVIKIRSPITDPSHFQAIN